MKKVFIVTAAIATGVTIGLALFFLGLNWYSSRPKPWSTRAITATFDNFGAKDGNFVLNYALQNNTDTDYRVEKSDQFEVVADLKVEKGLSKLNKDVLVIETPIFIPSKRRQAVTLRLAYAAPAENPNGPDSTGEEQNKFQETMFKELGKFNNFTGFRAFDTVNRYEIALPIPSSTAQIHQGPK